MRNTFVLAAILGAVGIPSIAPAATRPGPAPGPITPTYRVDYLAPFAVPAAQNARGDIAGYNPVYREAFVHLAGIGYRALPCLKDAICRAADINELGWVVGHLETTEPVPTRHAVLWQRTELTSYTLVELGAVSAEVWSDALAINNENQVVGNLAGAMGPAASRPFYWDEFSGMTELPLEGTVVDINDRGWVAGNGAVPFRYELEKGQLLPSELPVGFSGALAYAMNADGTLAGTLFDDLGASYFAVADFGGLWKPLGGKSEFNFASSVNAGGDLLGEATGLTLPSHTGIFFPEVGELRALEEFMFPAARAWVLGEIGAIGDDRSLTLSAIQSTTGLPGLVRLVPAADAGLCQENCLRASALLLSLAPSPTNPGSPSLAARVVLKPVTHLRYLPITVHGVWIGDGAIVKQVSARVGSDGSARFLYGSVPSTAHFYVTNITAQGYRFDPTQGTLHAVWSSPTDPYQK